MCGIAGFILKAGETVQDSQLHSMASAMIHRGPDSEGVFAHQNYGLAFRRLKIIDLSDSANQPQFSENGKVALIFNGEIYNFKELRKELEKVGYQFKTKSDTEVILHGYEEWGVGCFERLNGMFAVGILDLRKGRPFFYLARDRFGIKPLFYSFDQGRFAFASELKPLMLVPWISKDINPETLLYFLKFSHVPTPRSIFEGVKQLEPGTWLKLEEGELSAGRFFDTLSLVHKKSPPLGEMAALEELEELLLKVVSRQIISDVPVGCFLSGGIDSSLLTIAYASLKETRGKKIKTFTIGYKEKEFDEASFASEIAKAYETDHYELIVKPSDLFDLIPKIPDYFDQPFADPTLLPTVLLAKFAKEKVTVALSGDGGDELFWGYPHQRALKTLDWMTNLPFALRRGVFGGMDLLLSGVMQGPLNHKIGHQMRKFLDILQFQDEGQFYQNFVGTIGPVKMPRIAGLLCEKVDLSRSLYSKTLEGLGGIPLEEKVTQIFIKTFMLDTVLAKTDRAGMAVGLEARVPFLDNEMAEFSSRIPFGLKYKNGKSKYILRKLLEKKLGEKGLDTTLSQRRKQGFSIPMRDWLRGELRFLIDQYLSPERLKREGIFQSQNLDSLVKEHLDSKANHSHLIWSLLMFQMWKEKYKA